MSKVGTGSIGERRGRRHSNYYRAKTVARIRDLQYYFDRIRPLKDMNHLRDESYMDMDTVRRGLSTARLDRSSANYATNPPLKCVECGKKFAFSWVKGSGTIKVDLQKDVFKNIPSEDGVCDECKHKQD